jgi:predicted alpha/beta hydrolase
LQLGGPKDRLGCFTKTDEALVLNALAVVSSSRVREPTTYPNDPSIPAAFTVPAADGYPIRGFRWREAQGPSKIRPVVIVNAATSVRCRYYYRFAAFLFKRGFDVIVYDYRGIGESRPKSLRGFDASWIDWGRLDFEGILLDTARSFPAQPVHIVAHSVGGLLLGLAPSNRIIDRVFTVGAQYAYWRDYSRGAKLRLLAKWHLVMPLLTRLFGYFPGKRLGWLEDTPRGVVRDWTQSSERLEEKWLAPAYPDTQALRQQFASLSAPTLALSVTDDEFGTARAIERLLAYFTMSPRTHIRLTPESIGESAIGHFGFFHSRFEQKLWDIPLQWLKFARLPENHPATLLQPGDPHRADDKR